MRTLVLDPASAGLDAVLERRRRAGADRRDEVWEGVYHVVPGPSGPHADVDSQLAALLRPLAVAAGLTSSGQFNLGESEQDFRVPDGGLHRDRPGGAWQHTAALVFEIVSPGDESWEKLPYYAARGLDEVLIVNPQERSVSWLALHQGEYRPIDRSGLIALGADELAEQLDWPPIDAATAAS
jgi:Uma2 family endonuclease